jgi:hypothetical protein
MGRRNVDTELADAVKSEERGPIQKDQPLRRQSQDGHGGPCPHVYLGQQDEGADGGGLIWMRIFTRQSGD